MAAMPGFKVFQMICRSEIDKFNVALINARPSEVKEVLAAHLLVKAAAQFYAGITDRINEEIVQYTGTAGPALEPADPTEGMLDLGYVNAGLGLKDLNQFLEEYE